MDPYLGPVASALVAAVCAGLMLGLVRLSRVSLEWWRKRAARAAGGGAGAADDSELPADMDDTFDLSLVREARDAAFREANFVLGAAALAGAVGVAIALRLGFGAGAANVLPRAAAAGVGAVASALALAPLAILALVSSAFLVALADRGVTRLARRAGWPTTVSELDTARWLEAARLLWPGGDAAHRRREPAGVGLAYVALFAASAAAWGALVVAFRDATAPPLLLLGPLLLVVPLSYAAAAERSERNALARLRQAAAGRQLAVAPAWGMAIAATLPATSAVASVAAGAWAAIALVLATPLALPGTAVGTHWANWPRGGDAEEPSAGVRALSTVAHYAWLGAIALAVGLVFARGAHAAQGAGAADAAAAPGSTAVTALAVAAAVVLAVLVLRVAAGRADERVRRVIVATALVAGVLALAARRAAGAP